MNLCDISQRRVGVIPDSTGGRVAPFLIFIFVFIFLRAWPRVEDIDKIK
jgi:hypothetical protein